ncbi:hypoxanthine phosphoribosyltransferase [Arachidicoccus sp.]|uniref:hypoxanthine phosphoribosyltransferase n=1 Tax=Arachidicoccus sp. TaxID=1872624 RepID=UPI003D25B28D
MITIHNKNFVPYISEDEIKKKVKNLAEQISKDYDGMKPLFIAILNGAFMFASDLFKELEIEAEISFIKLASYKGMKSTGQVLTAIGLDFDINDRHVIIIEDIVDTGKTLHSFLPQLRHSQPKSIKLATLLHKPEALLFPVEIDYVCFAIPDKFVVGYGLDFDNLGRNLKEIYQIEE